MPKEHSLLMYSDSRSSVRISALHLLGLLTVDVVQAFCLTQLVDLHCRYSRLNLKVSEFFYASNGDVNVSAEGRNAQTLQPSTQAML